VAEHHHQRRVQDGDGVLDAAQYLRPDGVPRGTDHEQVTQPLVEDDLSGQSGVRAAEDHCERGLRAGQGGPVLGVLVGMSHRAGDETLVAGAQFVDGVGGCRGPFGHDSQRTENTSKIRASIAQISRDEVHSVPLTRRVYQLF